MESTSSSAVPKSVSQESVLERIYRLIGTSPLRTAAVFAIGGRVLFSGIAALLAPHLQLDPELVYSNAFTDHLMSQGEGSKYALLGVWERFDTLWYVHISQYGYDRPDAIVFYPLYPFLIWLSHLPPLIAALLISTVSCFLFAWGLQKLVMLDDAPIVGVRALVLYLVWPAGFMLFAAYPESLLLCCVVWAIYFARTGNALGTAIMALLAGATKALGALVFLPIAFIAIRNSKWRVLAASVFAGCVPVALAIWVSASGRMDAQQVYAAYWRTTVVPPWRTFLLSLNAAAPFVGLNMLALCLVLLFAFAFAKRFEYSLFAAAVLWLILSKQTMPLLQSTSRYVTLVFPAFINIGRELESRLRFVLFAAVLALIAFNVFGRFLEWWLIV